VGGVFVFGNGRVKGARLGYGDKECSAAVNILGEKDMFNH
jgi:hypothetical protein